MKFLFYDRLLQYGQVQLSFMGDLGVIMEIKIELFGGQFEFINYFSALYQGHPPPPHSPLHKKC